MTVTTAAPMTQDLLIEIGTEELPPTSLRDLSNAFAAGVARRLTELDVGFRSIDAFCTPRRLAVFLTGVAMQQPARAVSRRGPSVSAAFDKDGRPTKAAEGFARSCGVTVGELGREKSDKGEWLAFQGVEAGNSTGSLLPGIVEAELGALPIPKRMRWGAGEEEFVRPVHWACLVFGTEVVHGKILGIQATKQTRGHRFLAPQLLDIAHAAVYPELLRTEGWVEPDFSERRARIAAEVTGLALDRGLSAELPSGLLDEVTGLVEWPVALMGSFDPEFLIVPEEVLIETMQTHQKYFPVRDGSGNLAPHFIAVTNLLSRDPDQVRKGNERVIRPRFTDAKFFWGQDLKRPLSDYCQRLESVVFQEKLGSVADRVRRVQRLAREIATGVGEHPEVIERAAYLAKCDLVTAMVGEFPGLQGTMGRYYAEHSGESRAVCLAIEEQYYPRLSGGAIPSSGCGRVLGLADRLDLLVGIFGIGLRPTGTKDPYGLRRASIAVLRIVIETPLEIDLMRLLRYAQDGFCGGTLADETADSVLGYMLDRLAGYYDDQGISQDTVEAVVAAGGNSLTGMDQRIRALQAFRSTPTSLSLSSATKRIRNILTKNRIAPDLSLVAVPALLMEEPERVLWDRMQNLEAEIEPLIHKGDFSAILSRLATLQEPVDLFFDQVMVMAEDPLIRRNRLSLLQGLERLFLNVADFSRLQLATDSGI